MPKRTDWNAVVDKGWGNRKGAAGETQRVVQPWGAVFDQVQVFRLPDRIYAHSVSDGRLDEVEAKLGSPLPRSYREFMRHFGPGDLGPWVVLYEPTAEGGIVSLTEGYRGNVEAEPDYHPNASFLTRLVYFASSTGGDAYAWDPQDATYPEQQECQFFYMERAHRDNPVAAGRSFWEFLQWADNEYRHLRETEPKGETSIIRLQPWHTRMKEIPRQNDVHSWLRYNNSVARLIALSIRDRKQTDAFPVLADALEEAGCSHRDLLDSCRTGDPDIDGAWTLWVLLGDA